MEVLPDNVVVTKDPDLTTCLLVRSPHALVRLLPSLPPMSGFYTAHFLEGSRSTEFTGRSPSGVYVGVPWGTKDEMVALLQTAWAQAVNITPIKRDVQMTRPCGLIRSR